MIEVGQTTVSPAVAQGLSAFFLLAIGAVFRRRSRRDGRARSLRSTPWSKLKGIPAAMSAAAGDRSGTARHYDVAAHACRESRRARRHLRLRKCARGRVHRRADAAPAGAVGPQRLARSGKRARLHWTRRLGVLQARRRVPDRPWLSRGAHAQAACGRQPTSGRQRRNPIRGSRSRHSTASSPRKTSPSSSCRRRSSPASTRTSSRPAPRAISQPCRMRHSRSSSRGSRNRASSCSIQRRFSSEVRQSAPQYLATDTHWRPEAMELVAERLAAFVSQHVTLPAAPAPGFSIAEQEVTNRGDTAVMLDLPPGQTALPTRTRGHQPRARSGWERRGGRTAARTCSSSATASPTSTRWRRWVGVTRPDWWSTSATRSAVRSIGSFRTTTERSRRETILRRDGPERLAGKRVVIWQFAARELAFGDWKVIE